jgi:Leucine-rich repeat (LRR) protein
MSRSKVEIQVIDEKLLIEGLITNKIVSESDTLRGTSDINLVEIAPSVNTLILSFKRIGKIENLVGFNALTKLCLDNNAIEEICHLDHLTNLKWLDLSFNKIHRIQGLDKLSKLEDLSLYSNYIKKIDGLWNCSSLQCLSLGNNKIESLEEVQQLRKIRSLRMLTLSDNPVTDQPDYKTVVLAFISELKYLDYRLVMQEDRNTAKEIHADILDEVEQNENVYKEEKEREAKLLMEISKLEEAGISYAQTLFDDMFKDDTDLEKLLHFPFTKKIMEESFQTPYRELEESHTAESLKKYYQKRSQIVAFEKAVQELRNRDDNTSTLLIENYHRSKKQMVANFEKCQKMVKDPQNNVSEDYQKMVKELQISLPEHQRIVADTLQISFDSSRKLDEIYEFSTEDYQKLAKRLQTKIVEEVQKELDKVKLLCDSLFK